MKIEFDELPISAIMVASRRDGTMGDEAAVIFQLENGSRVGFHIKKKNWDMMKNVINSVFETIPVRGDMQ